MSARLRVLRFSGKRILQEGKAFPSAALCCGLPLLTGGYENYICLFCRHSVHYIVAAPVTPLIYNLEFSLNHWFYSHNSIVNKQIKLKKIVFIFFNFTLPSNMILNPFFSIMGLGCNINCNNSLDLVFVGSFLFQVS